MTQDTVVTTQKAFSDSQTMDLTDEEITNCFQILLPIVNRWRTKWGPKFMAPELCTMDDFEKAVSELEDEIKTRFFDIGILATVNPEPILEGEGPQVEFLGKLPKSDGSHLLQDHERKNWEVQRSRLTGEDYLGQNEVSKLL